MSDEFPGTPPPYWADPRKDPTFDPASVPFFYTDPDDGTRTTWRGMWDPDQDPDDYPYKVIPDPSTKIVPMSSTTMSWSSTGTSGSWGTPPSSFSFPAAPFGATVNEDDVELTDAEMLRSLAEWFEATQDLEDGEVEASLRSIADRLDEHVGPTERLEHAIRTLYEEVLSQPLVFDDRGDSSVAEAVETLAEWLSER